MLLRKFNAVLSLLTTVLLMNHAVFLSVWMLSRGGIAKSASSLPWVLTGLMAAHALLCILFAFLGHKGAEKRKCREYPKLNASAFAQRTTGMLMILLLGLHIAGAATHYQPKMLHAVLHPLFFALVLVHTALSTSKAFITLGIGNAGFIKAVNVLMLVLCAATLIAGVIGFYLCLFVGVVV